MGVRSAIDLSRAVVAPGTRRGWQDREPHGLEDVTRGDVDDSPAGPVADVGVDLPPLIPGGRVPRSVEFLVRQGDLLFGARERFGDVFRFDPMVYREPVVFTCHPSHVKSLMSASPDIAPTGAAESPLRPIVGPDSVLTALGERHTRQRRLLMPCFHGAAVTRYRDAIEAATARELDTWTAGSTVLIASSAQAITLDVIMSGVFGIEGRPQASSPEGRLRRAVLRLLNLSTSGLNKPVEMISMWSLDPIGPLKWILDHVDKTVFAVIDERRRSGVRGDDVLSLLLDARAEDGAELSNRELRDELMTLVLAGHETTANTVAWACERLTRTPSAYDALRSSVRDGDDAYLEATIHETMRVRPVVPITGRRPQVPWQLGEYVVPARSRVLISILLLHHRPDVYPDPFAFRPERFVGVKPGAHTWLPFGGGTRRCLGALLAMEELRIVLREIVRRADLELTAAAPERPQHRNVTMIPADGGAVRLAAVRG